MVDRPDYDVVGEALGMPHGSIGPTRGRCLAKLRALLLADPLWRRRDDDARDLDGAGDARTSLRRLDEILARLGGCSTALDGPPEGFDERMRFAVAAARTDRELARLEEQDLPPPGPSDRPPGP